MDGLAQVWGSAPLIMGMLIHMRKPTPTESRAAPKLM
ncbi:hypothetical protein BFZC1_08990 [Lysinibacillus fusiformis ZC1]|nr:hypothetical protein BFZC1_08990 [Lysinibacillus fusiformis ZC1]